VHRRRTRGREFSRVYLIGDRIDARKGTFVTKGSSLVARPIFRGHGVRLGNNHTQATKRDAPTPQAYVADNDYALGRLVDTVSRSSIWKDTAIFVTEDDAQNGPDHVDAHRTIGLVISPYTQTGKVDSTFYSTASMVCTIGLATRCFGPTC
jgi:hypothetical protein